MDTFGNGFGDWNLNWKKWQERQRPHDHFARGLNSSQPGTPDARRASDDGRGSDPGARGTARQATATPHPPCNQRNRSSQALKARFDPQQRSQRRRELHRIHRQGHRGLGPAPGRQPGVLRAPDQQQHRRAVEDLVLDLPAHAHAAHGHGLAVQHADVDAALVQVASGRRQASRTRGTRRRARRRRAAARSPAAPARGCWRRRCRPAPWRSAALFLRDISVVRTDGPGPLGRMLLPRTPCQNTARTAVRWAIRAGHTPRTHRTAPPGVRAG